MSLPSNQWSIQDAIGGLEGFAEIIGYCDLSRYIETACECMEYVLDKHIEEEND